jgi:hypothetical protein
VETISGSLAVAVHPGEPALVITLDLELDGARDLAQTLGRAQGLATVRDLDRGAVLAPEMGRHRVVEVGLDLARAAAPGWVTEPGQVVGAGRLEAGQDSERAVVPAGAAELAPAVALGRAQTQEPSRPEWAGGSLPRHY